MERDQAQVELTELAKEYERLKDSMPPGRDRAYPMTLVLTRARALGRQVRLDTAQINHLPESSDGTGWLEFPLLRDVRPKWTWAAFLTWSRGQGQAFEQYAALAALPRAAPEAPIRASQTSDGNPQRRTRSSGKRLDRNSDHYQLAATIPRALGARLSPHSRWPLAAILVRQYRSAPDDY